MNKRTWIKLAFVACLAAVSAPSLPASAQVSLSIGVPPAVIATSAPVYFDGRPTYWYNNRWYYRDARRRWNWYRTEPPGLRSWRMRNPPRSFHYGRRRW